MENIFHRVSIRKYEDKPVEKEKILQILKASYSGAFSILSSCRVCKNTFYGVFMF